MPAREFHLPLPDGLRPIVVARSAWLASGFVNYGPEGDLSYRELFLAVLVRARKEVGLHVIAIWVDSEASLRGGRALWGVPKQLAQFHVTGAEWPQVEGVTSEGVLARSSFRARWRWPLRSRARAIVVQQNQGALQYTPAIASASIAFGTAHWQFPDASPLQVLRRRKPILSVELTDARVRFGA
jgi:hypothetical protein